MPPVVKNLMESLPGETETFRPLLDMPGIRLEQIVSNGQASAEGFWYPQMFWRKHRVRITILLFSKSPSHHD